MQLASCIPVELQVSSLHGIAEPCMHGCLNAFFSAAACLHASHGVHAVPSHITCDLCNGTTVVDVVALCVHLVMREGKSFTPMICTGGNDNGIYRPQDLTLVHQHMYTLVQACKVMSYKRKQTAKLCK